MLLPAAARTTGPVGFSLFRDDVEVSARDLTVLMLTISDNVCTDALLDRVGLEAAQDRLRLASALWPDSPTRTTPRDMTRLLRLIWTGRAGPAEACVRVRWLMTRQLTRGRLALGFGPECTVAAKSGALMGVVRNEVGVVTLPDCAAYAVAVFTRTDEPGADERAVDAAIGEAAAQAVAELSSRARTP